jgi:hypothetical protein
MKNLHHRVQHFRLKNLPNSLKLFKITKTFPKTPEMHPDPTNFCSKKHRTQLLSNALQIRLQKITKTSKHQKNDK